MRYKVMPLSGEEFIRRFLLHVLPKGLMRVRHYGYLANRCRAERLITIRTAIAQQQPVHTPAAVPDKPPPFKGWTCPECEPGWMHIVARLLPRLEPGG